MRRWQVTSPFYTYVEAVYEGQGPTYEARHYCEVEAPTKAKAKGLAIKAWRKRKTNWAGLPYPPPPPLPSAVMDIDPDASLDYCDFGAINPFKGVEAEELFPCPLHEWDVEACAAGITYNEAGDSISPCENRDIHNRAVRVLGEDYFA